MKPSPLKVANAWSGPSVTVKDIKPGFNHQCAVLCSPFDAIQRTENQVINQPRLHRRSLQRNGEARELRAEKEARSKQAADKGWRT